MRKTALTFATGFIAGGSVMAYKLINRRHGLAAPPEWLESYTQNKGWQESTMYERYLDLRSLSTTFFENEVVEKIKGYNFFKIYTVKDNSDKLICIFNANQNMCFHEKILHGGATSLLMDNLFGYVAIHSVKRLVATAFINVNYRKPLYCHRLYAAEVYITKTQGRKIRVEGKIYPIQQHQEQASSNKPCIQANALMVTVDWSKSIQSLMKKFFQDEKK